VEDYKRLTRDNLIVNRPLVGQETFSAMLETLVYNWLVEKGMK